MNLSPILPKKKNVKIDEDFFSIEAKDSSPEKKNKKTHSLVDIKIDLNENEEDKKEEPMKAVNNYNFFTKHPKEMKESLNKMNFVEKRRLSRAVETNLGMQLDLDSIEKSPNSNNINIESKSSYSYSSSSSSISIEDQQKLQINNIIT